MSEGYRDQAPREPEGRIFLSDALHLAVTPEDTHEIIMMAEGGEGGLLDPMWVPSASIAAYLRTRRST